LLQLPPLIEPSVPVPVNTPVSGRRRIRSG